MILKARIMRFALLTVSISMLLGCNVPSEQKISTDFYTVFSKEIGTNLRPIITSMGAGEGNFESVYEHVKFDVTTDKDVFIDKGWLSGISLSKRQKLHGGEIVLLYQKSGSSWQMTWYDLLQVPRQQTDRFTDF